MSGEHFVFPQPGIAASQMVALELFLKVSVCDQPGHWRSTVEQAVELQVPNGSSLQDMNWQSAWVAVPHPPVLPQQTTPVPHPLHPVAIWLWVQSGSFFTVVQALALQVPDESPQVRPVQVDAEASAHFPVSAQQIEPVAHWPHIFIWSLVQWGTVFTTLQASAVQGDSAPHDSIKLQLFAFTGEHPPVLVQQILPTAHPVHFAIWALVQLSMAYTVDMFMEKRKTMAMNAVTAATPTLPLFFNRNMSSIMSHCFIGFSSLSVFPGMQFT
jgi:hypothetical protein